jgi:hypothetical protein
MGTLQRKVNFTLEHFPLVQFGLFAPRKDVSIRSFNPFLLLAAALSSRAVAFAAINPHQLATLAYSGSLKDHGIRS